MVPKEYKEHYKLMLYYDLKVEGRYNNGVIISQGKYNLFGNDKNKIIDHQK
jgi:hypothetical protein